MKKIFALLLALVLVLSLSATAMAAAPSVEATGAPEITTITTESGEKAAAIVVDKDGNEVSALTDADITVTPVAKSEDAEVKDAYDTIKDAKSLTAVCENLEDVVAAVDKDVKADDLVVLDVFGITVSKEAKALLDEGNSVKMNFKTDLKPGDTLVVLQFIDGKWVALEVENVVINDDGTVTLSLNNAAPIAFLTKGA